MGNEENDQLKRQNLSAYESGSNNAKLKTLNPLMASHLLGLVQRERLVISVGRRSSGGRLESCTQRGIHVCLYFSFLRASFSLYSASAV